LKVDQNEVGGIARQLVARLDRLPATRSIWKIVGLLSLAFFFELYNLLLPGYIAPGLIQDKLFTTTTVGLFGTTGIASFVAAMFAGLTLGTICGGWLIDRFGRRASIMWSLLEVVAASVVMACASSASLINLCRLIAGIGLGVEMITINTYISELVPSDLRGRAFATSQAIGFVGVPVVAVLSWIFVPHSLFGVSGWRWVVLIGAASAIGAWYVRRNLPESPRWLVQRGRLLEAEDVISRLERKVEAEYGRPLPPPGAGAEVLTAGSFAEIWKQPYRKRALMMIIFHIFQTFGYYGFTNWVPAFMVSHGISVTKGLLYTAVIAFSAPIGPILGFAFADRVERKWLIILGSSLVAIAGLAFGSTRDPVLLIVTGIVITIGSNMMSFAYHAYQTEIFPTRIRAKAVGFVYSFSRSSAMITAFVIAYLLRIGGVAGVFLAIAGTYVVVALTVAILGPRTTGQPLEEISQ
jgi:MFS transporter, putative metabolite:H+ symporter